MTYVLKWYPPKRAVQEMSWASDLSTALDQAKEEATRPHIAPYNPVIVIRTDEVVWKP